MAGAVLALACHSVFAASPQARPLIEQETPPFAPLRSTQALALFDQAAKADPSDVEIILRISQQCSSLISQAKSAHRRRWPMPAAPCREAKTGRHLRAGQSRRRTWRLAVAYGRLTDFEDNRTKVEFSRHVKSGGRSHAGMDPKEDFAYHVLGPLELRA